MSRRSADPGSRSSRRTRGSALILAVVALVALSVLALAAIHFSGKENEVTQHVSRAEEVLACAEAARQNLLARFRAVGINPTQIKLACPSSSTPGVECVRLADDPNLARRSILSTGHYRQAQLPTVQGVEVVTGGVGAGGGVRDLTNSLAASPTLGGQFYRIIVSCHSRGRESEVEMLVRFGI